MAVSDELIGFVREALTQGVPRAQVENVLRQAGWSHEQVSGALAAFASVDFPVPVPRPRPSLSARDAFTYLLMFSTLYIVAYHLGSLVFRIIDLIFPDPADNLANPLSSASSVRFSISSLIVALPVFLYMSRLSARAIARDPNERLSPIRRWLTYLTLFIAACVLIGDLTSVVYNLLGGELTIRFLLKALTVGVIAGAALWFYLSDLHADERESGS